MPVVPARFLPALILLFACSHPLQVQTAVSAIDQARRLEKPPAVVVSAVDAKANPSSVFTNHANYSGFGGNNSTTGTFGGSGATTQPLANAPGYK